MYTYTVKPKSSNLTTSILAKLQLKVRLKIDKNVIFYKENNCCYHLRRFEHKN